MRSIGIAVFGFLALALPAQAQSEEKAEITVSNGRNEPLVMSFDYAFRQYTWKLMEQAIPVDEQITYRYPSNIPGCEKLHEWGIADGVLTISDSAGPLCQKRVSLCDKTTTFMDVGLERCTWRENPARSIATP
ncbi:MAG: hypothetical protein EPO08_13475 [Rhodospirillaceae bacterium]|nr:MAG: hypothetical protein EPO08_13475 [Rhodospirillaceae bacterium]